MNSLCMIGRRYSLACMVALLLCGQSHAQMQPQSAPPADPMLGLLMKMVAEDPSRADTWRLIGRIHRKQNRTNEAIDATRRALSIQPDNAAAHSDLGELMAQVGDQAAAAFHYDQVMALAPNSSYANQLVARGIRAPRQTDLAPANVPTALDQVGVMPIQQQRNRPDSSAAYGSQGDIMQVGYEIQTFDGADDQERRLNQLQSDTINPSKRLRAFIEFGALYNTNVSLTPISRELTGGEAASFQGFLSPDLELLTIDRGPWRSGPLLRGYFTVNENNFRSLNLASFQPGAFVERDASWGDQQYIGRIDYVYSLDLLDGDRFGNRHAMTASLTTILPEADVIYTYITASTSDFAQDGATPAVDSLDGQSLTAGTSRFYSTGWSFVPTWSLGGDVEWADTEGADYRYQAINFHGDTTIQLLSQLSFIPRVGVGYRTYDDFTGPISRDELTYRVSARLKWKLNDSFAISGVAGYDRFASDNADFDSDRVEAGIVFTVLQ